MPNIIEITAPELDIYARLTQAQLRSRLEPEKGIFIAESPKVIARALDAGYTPLSLLMERRQIIGPAAEILTQYACRTDALYYQGKIDSPDGRKSLPYAERYHYVYPEKLGNELAEIAGDGLLMLHRQDLEYLDLPYHVVDTVGEYFLLTVDKDSEDEVLN